MNNLGDLEIFARVVAAGSMSSAGRELGLSPAVVSKNCVASKIAWARDFCSAPRGKSH
jgi:hypothetical protein